MHINKEKLREEIIRREKLRNISRMIRLLRDPLGAIPYYALAALGHIRPFRIRFKTLWGTHMACYLPEGNTFYYYGYCEANLACFFLRLIQPGDCFFDVGAHVGFYSMLASELVGQEGKVASFEPTPWTYLLLKENTSPLANVETNNNAVGSEAKMLSFSDFGPGYGAFNSANEKWAETTLKGKKEKSIRVEAVTLDGYCREKNIAPGIIKVDTEGFEYDVLIGAKSLLEKGSGRQRPVVTLEMAGGSAWAENQSKAQKLLESWGFTAYEIAVDGSLRRGKIRGNYSYDNIAFLPEERAAELSYLLNP